MRSEKGHSKKITIKSSILPDGVSRLCYHEIYIWWYMQTRETTKIVVDSKGNEEVTVTRSKDHKTLHHYEGK